MCFFSNSSAKQLFSVVGRFRSIDYSVAYCFLERNSERVFVCFLLFFSWMMSQRLVHSK